VAQRASPRGTFQKITDALKARITDDPEMVELPPIADLVDSYGVLRGVVLRAFQVLRRDGVTEPVPGGRHRG
jgi:DNA-binding FadR family transcriptional regulator